MEVDFSFNKVIFVVKVVVVVDLFMYFASVCECFLQTIGRHCSGELTYFFIGKVVTYTLIVTRFDGSIIYFTVQTLYYQKNE